MRAFWLLVLAPLAIAGYLAVRVSSEGAELRRHEVQRLLDGRLADVRDRTRGALAALERQLEDQLAAAPTSADDLRGLGRRIPIARQVFRLDARGRMVFPRLADDTSTAEREFLERTTSIWTGRAILASSKESARSDGTSHVGHDVRRADKRRASDPSSDDGSNPARATIAKAETSVVRGTQRVKDEGAAGVGDSLIDLSRDQTHGWLSWYWAEGLHLLFWRRAPDGGVIGVEVERVGVLARVVGALPTTELADGRMELADGTGLTIHQWGPMLPVEGAPVTKPDAIAALDAPLDSWQLRYFVSETQRAALSAGPGIALLLGLGALGLALVGLAVYIYREYTRRLREAAQRVDFVTQVSHELRTPLTNIRMYAELIDDALVDDEQDEDQRRRARVIVQESRRLGRLIDNVLAFARHQRGTLASTPLTSDVDHVVRETVAKFEPALEARAIAVKLELGQPPAVRAGADAVDQIVANLISNVEKYAAAGGEVTVSTRAQNGHVIVGVADRGPGIPVGERDAIFEPFHRASDSLAEGASGTGIGLAIARELARAAGGELALAETEHGACFELTLPVAGDEP